MTETETRKPRHIVANPVVNPWCSHGVCHVRLGEMPRQEALDRAKAGTLKCAEHLAPKATKVQPHQDLVGEKAKFNGKNFEILRVFTQGVLLRTGGKTKIGERTWDGKAVKWEDLDEDPRKPGTEQDEPF